MEALKSEIDEVKKEISDAFHDLRTEEAKEADIDQSKVTYLREKEMSLRHKETSLRDKENLLLQSPNSKSLSPISDAHQLFAEGLVSAKRGGDVLTLQNGSTFFADPVAYDKTMYIRKCYDDLWSIIEKKKAERIFKFVIIGTSGIGKSYFGFDLLQRLRGKGVTVVYQLKERWWRFSGGVEAGDKILVERSAGPFDAKLYMDDQDSWFLCDPDGQPYTSFRGTTVVFASPQKIRYHTFLKENRSMALYMPTWQEQELLTCRRLVYTSCDKEVVKGVCGLMGGVPRVVFGTFSLDYWRRTIKHVAFTVTPEKLRTVADLAVSSPSPSTIDPAFSTDGISDKVVHMMASEDYETYTLQFASEYCKEVIVNQLMSRNRQACAELFLRPLQENRNDDAGSVLTASVVGAIFENYAHKHLLAGEGKFGDGEDDDGWRAKFSSMNFAEFEGSSVPCISPNMYYRPSNQNFKGIDGIARDSTNVVYFTQMKSSKKIQVGADIEAVKSYWSDLKAKQPDLSRCVYMLVVPDSALTLLGKRKSKTENCLKGFGVCSIVFVGIDVSGK